MTRSPTSSAGLMLPEATATHGVVAARAIWFRWGVFCCFCDDFFVWSYGLMVYCILKVPTMWFSYVKFVIISPETISVMSVVAIMVQS